MDILHVPTRIVITPADPRSIVPREVERHEGTADHHFHADHGPPAAAHVSLPETPYILWPLGLSLSVDNVNRHLPQASFRTRAELRAQILALRHQLAVLQQSAFDGFGSVEPTAS